MRSSRRCCRRAAAVERAACSSPGHAPDLLATPHGHRHGPGAAARPPRHGRSRTPSTGRSSDAARRLVGSGCRRHEGRGGAGARRDAGAGRDCPRHSPSSTCSRSTTRSGAPAGSRTGPRFAGHDACLCFEAGERGPDGEDARGRAAQGGRHAAGRPPAASRRTPVRRAGAGRNALLALAEVARTVAGLSDPRGPRAPDGGADRDPRRRRVQRRPRPRRAGLRPARRRARSLRARSSRRSRASVEGVELEAEIVRRWPGMDTREQVAERLLEPAESLLGRPARAGERGGASDASHLAAHVPLTVDGLGPRGGKRAQPRRVRAARLAAHARRGRARRRRGGAAASAERGPVI